MKTPLLIFDKNRDEGVNYKVVVVLLAGIIVTLSLFASATTGNWSWFHRSGSILVLSGVVFNKDTFFSIDRLNIAVTVLGTLIWAYGDLVGQCKYLL